MHDAIPLLWGRWHTTVEQLLALYGVAEDWSGDDVEPPNLSAVATALWWSFGAATRTRRVRAPTRVTVGERGEVIMTWVGGVGRVQAVFTGPGEVEFVCRRGSETTYGFDQALRYI